MPGIWGLQLTTIGAMCTMSQRRVHTAFQDQPNYSHNTAKFGSRWKTLGVSGCVDIGSPTNPKRGFYHPPEAVSLETRNVSLGDKNVGASVVSVASDVTFDIWAYGVLFYEAIAGLPLSPYRSLHKANRALTTAELFKVGQWDDRSLRKALRHIANDTAQDLVKKLLQPDPNSRAQSMRDVLSHPFFGIGKLAGGSGPVFDRPKLSPTSASNNLVTKEKTPVLINAARVMPQSSPEPPPASVNVTEPKQPAATVNPTSCVLDIKVPAPKQPIATVNAPASIQETSAASSKKSSKFGMKNMFGKKK